MNSRMRGGTGETRRRSVVVNAEGHHINHRDIHLHAVGVGRTDLVALFDAVEVANDRILIRRRLV